MKRFKVKDLMIDVLPAEAELACRFFTPDCRGYITPDCRGYITPDCLGYITPDCLGYFTPCHWYPTQCHYFITCDWFRTCYHTWDCVPWRTCRPFISPAIAECARNSELEVCTGNSRLDFEQLVHPEELGVLREQLQAALDRVKTAEERAARQMAPQSVDEVNLLREKLKEAMDELDEIEKGIREG